MSDKPDPIQPLDKDARDIARGLIHGARFAALAVTSPDTGSPMVTRIACVPGPDGLPLSLVSDLSEHTRALLTNPACALLVGEPEPKGDPLVHPRLSLQGHAHFVRHRNAEHPVLARHYLSLYPKAKLYIGFADFSLVKFTVTRGFLNAGFGKAYELAPDDF